MASTESDHAAMATAQRPHGQGDLTDDGSAPRNTTAADVEATLRALPSHGAARGWTGRRDRALLVLSQVAQIPAGSVAELTAGDIGISAGVATIRTPDGSTTLRRSDDVLICAPCVLARWLHALDLTVLQPTQVVASVIARCAPLTANSPHFCEGTLTLAPATRVMPVFPVTDSWGPYDRWQPALLGQRRDTVRAGG